MTIAIILPCYNRIEALKELCATLKKADYLGDKVDLVFSIDYSGTDIVSRFANSYNWPYGNKRVIIHEHNIGLRNNILFCGDLTSEYDAVIIIEDDLEVTPSFYRYAKQAAEFYDNDDRIAGVSIFAYHLEELTISEFYPYYEGYDGCFIQWASSWGQLWTRKHWKGFRDWYSEDMDISNINMPKRVKEWKKSWKKYYIAYLVETNKYFVFPFLSHIYNGNKAGGVHTSGTEPIIEVITSSPLDLTIRDYHFAKLDDVEHKYDVFFQHEPLYVYVQGKSYFCEFDLYGHKEKPEMPYIITSRNCSKTIIIESFDCGMIPFEQNIILNKKGKNYHLISSKDFHRTLPIPAACYFQIRKRASSAKQTLVICIDQLKKAIKRRLL